MTILIFVVILAILILVHEFGHFIVAKAFGIRVDEFGIGFPPKIIKLFRWRETDFTLNYIPFGGFVKIFGENPDEESLNGPDKKRSFALKPKGVQAAVLIAGVFFNVLFAWVLISLAFVNGMPSILDERQQGDEALIISGVLSNSPAEKAGIIAGDEILFVSSNNMVLEDISINSVSEFIAGQTEELKITVLREGEEVEIGVFGSDNIIEGRKAIGVSMHYIGVLKYPFFKSFLEGGKRTLILTRDVTLGLGHFLKNIVLGQADFAQVSGPVGIVKLVGDASNLGFMYLVNFTAFISINLAVINLVPFPALDGGRLLFIIIESILRRKIDNKVANTLNAAGFLILILLMIIVTFFDFSRIFGF